MEDSETLKEKVARWRFIRDRKGLDGDNASQSEADDYYRTEIKPEIIRLAKERYDASGSGEHFAFLVSMSGFSPMTSIIAYELLRPRRLLIIGSEAADRSYDTIVEHIVTDGRLTYRNILYRPCDPTRPHTIYRIIREELRRARRSKLARDDFKAIIDITGGKKVMSAAAAQAAWRLDLPLCYVDSRYDPVLRQPRFGTENLIFLENPVVLYGDEEMLTAREIFLNGQYDRAYETFSVLAEKVTEPRAARLLRDLSDMYRAWCNLEIERLPAVLDTMSQRLQTPLVREVVSAGQVANIKRQIAFLRDLAAKDDTALLLSFFILGRHYANLGRYDFAVLLFYRTIEGCFRARLERVYKGFATASPDYTLLPASYRQLVESYNRAAARLSRPRRVNDLPPVLGLMTSALLLTALEDSIADALRLDEAKGLSALRNVCDIRNKSILAHGFESISRSNSRELEAMAQRVLKAIWKWLPGASALGGDVSAAYQQLQFVRLQHVQI